MLIKEYRIPMPLQVSEYKIGQLYMIARHSASNTKKGEGIEIVTNEPCESEDLGPGQYTEKRVHLGRFKVKVTTTYRDDRGDTDSAAIPALSDGEKRDVVVLDIANDEVPEKHQHECDDLKEWHSVKVDRGPLKGNWMVGFAAITTAFLFGFMLSSLVVEASFGVWGLQGKTESFIHKKVREILIVGHIQAVAWLDDWISMDMEALREYEAQKNAEANASIAHSLSQEKAAGSTPALAANEEDE